MTSTNASLPSVSGFTFRLSDLQMIGYGALFVTYNVGLSPVYGVVRLLIAVPYYLKHKKQAQTYLKVHEAVDETIKTSSVNDKERSQTLQEKLTKIKSKIFTLYKEATPDRMSKFWLYQIFRGITEIFIPHVGPQIWTFRDFTCESIFKNRLGIQIGSDDNISRSGKDTFSYSLQLNIAGNRELEKALKWEEGHENTVSDKEIDLRSTLKKENKPSYFGWKKGNRKKKTTFTMTKQ